MRVAGCVVFASGCWTSTAPAPVSPIERSENVVIVDAPRGAPIAGTSGVSRRRERFPLHSVWEGTYVCAQGLSSVILTIDAMRNGTATARYDFGPVPSNPTVPVGAYLLKGEIHATGGRGFVANLEADSWIDHPSGYFMVGLELESTDGKTMTGQIKHASCSDFKTTRIH